MNLKRFIATLTVSLFVFSQTAWSGERPADIRGIRALGMGDAFTAVADDQNIFFYNPAGLTQRTKGQFSLVELSATIGTDLIDVIDYISDNEDELTKFNDQTPAKQAELINEIDRTISKLDPHVGVGLSAPNYISGPSSKRSIHWGLGAFSQVDGGFRLNTGIIPNIDYDINVDVVVPFTMAKRFKEVPFIPGKLGVGGTIKLLRRGSIRDRRVSFLQLEEYDDPPLQTAQGFGLDLGLLYQPVDRWNVALTAFDFMGTSLSFDAETASKGFLPKPERTGVINPRWNIGTAWTPSKVTLWPSWEGLSTGDRLVLAADVKDIFNADDKVLFGDKFIPDTAWTHLHFGLEYRWWFLRLRTGLNQGYNTVGLGVDIPFIKVDYAFFSDELTLFAGGKKQSNHMLSLAFRFGSGHTEARERIAENKDKE